MPVNLKLLCTGPNSSITFTYIDIVFEIQLN